MDKLSFNSMEIEKQVSVFNEMLNGSSIRQVAEQIGIAKTTVRDRFKKSGYIYSSEFNQYIKSCDEVGVILNNNSIVKDNTSKKVISKNNKDLSYNENIDSVYSELLELLALKEDIKALLKKEKLKENIIESHELKINKFDSELKVKSLKIYDEVLMEFSKFMSNNKELKQQDVVSQALWEFIKKYK